MEKELQFKNQIQENAPDIVRGVEAKLIEEIRSHLLCVCVCVQRNTC